MSPEEAKPDEAAAEALREAAGDPLGAPPPQEPRENSLLAWVKAIGLGIRDTAQDVLDEGRKGARAKQSQMWSEFDAKTKHRRR